MFGQTLVIVGILEVESSHLFFMFDLYDLLSPRVYVVSEKQYDEILDKKRKRHREALEARRKVYEGYIADIDKELKELA